MIEEIFNGPYLKRLDNIKQWSERDTLTSESVAQHSFKVAVFCKVLLDDLFAYASQEQYATQVRTHLELRAITHALFHDWDESLLLRDISHETKYNDFNGDALRAELTKLAEHLSQEEFCKSNSPSGNALHAAIFCHDEVVKHICKVCDWLALLFFVKREESLGNDMGTELKRRCATKSFAAIDDLEKDIRSDADLIAMTNFSVLYELRNIVKAWRL